MLCLPPAKKSIEKKYLKEALFFLALRFQMARAAKHLSELRRKSFYGKLDERTVHSPGNHSYHSISDSARAKFEEDLFWKVQEIEDRLKTEQALTWLGETSFHTSVRQRLEQTPWLAVELPGWQYFGEKVAAEQYAEKAAIEMQRWHDLRNFTQWSAWVRDGTESRYNTCQPILSFKGESLGLKAV